METMQTTQTTQTTEFWAVVEINGRRQLAGLCRTLRRFGVEGLAIKVPEPDGETFLPEMFYPGHSLFSVLECNEGAARAAATRSCDTEEFRRLLVQASRDLPALPAAHADDHDPGDDAD